MSKKTICIIWIAAVAAVFLAVNTVIPFFSDDADCAYLNGRRVSGVGGIVDTIIFDYFFINGRILCNAAALTSIIAGETFFNIANTVVFTLTVWLMCKVVESPSGVFRPLVPVVAVVGLLALSTGADSLYYWASGSTNYLWALAANLAFLLLLKNNASGHATPLRLAAAAAASFVLALNNEMFVCPLAATLAICLIFGRMSANKSTLILTAAFMLGAFVVFCAPGNFARETLYTTGLGYASRVVKIMYGLRLTYVMLLMLLIFFIRNRAKALAFTKAHAPLFVMLAMSAVIPFLAASTGRSLYAIETSALLVILRLTAATGVSRRTETVISGTLAAATLAVMLMIFGDSKTKWNIVDGALRQYYAQPGNTVVIDDYQSRLALIEHYTVNIDNIFMPCDKSNQYALEKMKRNGLAANYEYVNDDKYIKILPGNVLDKITHSPEALFAPENKIDGIGFYHDNSLIYSVMPYDSLTLDSINGGHMYAVYSFAPYPRIKVRINYMAHDIGFERAAFYVDTPRGRFILLNRKYKRYPLLNIEGIYLAPVPPESKIEVQMGN